MAGWSGTVAEFESEVNLSTSFGVVAGNTVQVALRMAQDTFVSGTGWDVNWVKVYGSAPLTTANGDIIAAGHIYAHSSTHIGDLAECVQVSEPTEPGDLLVVSDDPNVFALSRKPGDPRLAGVHSSDPSVFLNRPTGGVPLALSGRVYVKVCGDVEPGDALASSSVPGHAMKATEACCVVGVALEKHSGSEPGKILVLLRPGWHVPEQKKR